MKSILRLLFAAVILMAGVMQAQTPLSFVAVTPCRVADTRLPYGAFGGPSVQGRTVRTFVVPQSECKIPSNAGAYSLNVTVAPYTILGYLTLWPAGEAQPFVSTLNAMNGNVFGQQQYVANAAIVPAGRDGAISIYVTDTTDVILDINGYFVTVDNDKDKDKDKDKDTAVTENVVIVVADPDKN